MTFIIFILVFYVSKNVAVDKISTFKSGILAFKGFIQVITLACLLISGNTSKSVFI